jgi:ABC-type multidrug transport system ATPase subunit
MAMPAADMWRAGSKRSSASGIWRGGDDVFSRSSRSRDHEDDEEALKWAALEKLPTYDRIRKGILHSVAGEHEEVDVAKIGLQDRQLLIDRLLKIAAEDNERFLLKLRNRIDKVGIDMPKIEVRFEHLNVDADVYVGSRSLPSIPNFTLNMLESFLGFLKIFPNKKRPLSILHDVSGILRPCRMTLLLGPPGSGKTSLLLALAGKLDSELRVSGSVTYNGHKLDEFVPQRTSAYISQHDLHIGEMTVRETMDFSGRCQGVGTRYDKLVELSRREKQAGIKPDPDIDVFMKAIAMEGQETSLVTDYILKILGLDICGDTIVGDDMRRGISGGQKKRVTTAEMLVGPARALFMDEISTGLDSSTTFQIVKCLRQSVHVLDGTTFVSLLQPAPETYDLFDDIVLLSEGQVVYQGPREDVLEFFESMGFKCPDRKGVADFLQEVTSKKDQQQYWAWRDQPYRYVTVREFADAFQSFHVGLKLAQELSEPYDKTKSHPAALTFSRYGVNKKELFKACFWREWLLMRRNSFVYVFKTSQLSVMAFITMTVFLRTKLHHESPNDGNIYMGALFFALITCMFNGFAELSMTIQKLPTFYKQRDLLFFPSWAYSLPIWVLRIPISLLEAGIWVFITYYVIGYDPFVGRLFRQYLLLVCVHQMSTSLFRFIASLGRTMIVANTFGSFALVIILLLGGFLLSRHDIKGWWIWGYWISPLMYAQNAISVNEFLGHSWNKPTLANNGSILSSDPLGVYILKSRGIFPHGYWYWLGVAALLGYTVFFNFCFTLALSYLKPLGKAQAAVTEEALQDNNAIKTGGNMAVELSSRRGKSTVESTSASGGRAGEIVRRSGVSSTGSLSDRMGATGAATSGEGKKGMVLPFQPLSIAFDDVCYFVDMPGEMKEQGVTETRLQLLKNVSGAFRPGVLTALVGVSGAGKTTMMDVLAGRKTGGYIEGNISISGFPKNQETFARISGYCEQNDIHSPQVTVHESLIYSAWLRLGSDVDAERRKLFVEEVMELVELNSLRDSLVGLPGVTGLSTEQRKRLTIAVELVANPSIIFMDEPTSGLDARAAAIVMRTVRNTVDTGRTVVCTIHQPSIDIFEAFDELFLMKRGGQVIYAGPLGRHSHKLVEYFESIDGVTKITDGYNPATWMLEVSSVAVENRLGMDFAEIYRNSELHQRNKALIKELSTPAPGAKDLYFPTLYSQPFFTQCAACFWKQRLSYWRNPQYTAVRFFFTFICGIMFGTIFWRTGNKRSRQTDITNAMGSMYAAVLFIGINNSSSVQPLVEIERTVFYREKAAGMYSALPYAFSQATIEIPYVFIQSVIYSLMVYSMMDFQWEAAKFFWYLFFSFFTFLYFTYYGMMNMALTPNHNISAIVSSAFYLIWNLFSGFLIPRKKIPIWWRWYYWACPVAWTLYGLVVSQFGDLDHVELEVVGGTTQTAKEFVKDYFGFDHDFLGAVAGATVGFCVLFAFVFSLGVKYLNFQHR